MMKKSVPPIHLFAMVLLHGSAALVVLWAFGAFWHDLPFTDWARKAAAVVLAFRAGGLAFETLKQRSLINEAARVAGDSPDFSRRIRANAPSFQL